MASSFLSRLRKPGSSDAVDGIAVRPPAARRPLPHAGQLRRERRALTRVRGERIRDLGGIVLEMYRRDRFREDLVYEHAAAVVEVEERLQQIDALLAADAVRRGATPRCSCGAPLVRGSHFCANCGRPVGRRVVVACGSCGHPLPADARFCVNCATPVEAANGEAPAADG